MEIPSGLDWWRQRPEGVAWLGRLPRLVSECSEIWALEVGPPYAGSHVSFVAPVELEDGTPAVLKLFVPGLWVNDREGDALAVWDGRGAVRLLAQDRERGALLIESCDPGTSLRTVSDADEALAIEADLLERIWRPPPVGQAFGLLADDVTRWADAFPGVWEQLGYPFERRLVDAAVSTARELAPTQGKQVLLHQDFHSANVLSAEREPWLVIDPQPLVGERELDAASLLRDRRHELFREPDPLAEVQRRLDWLTERLGLDRQRTRSWGVVHALAWGVSAIGKVEEDMVACARLLLVA